MTEQVNLKIGLGIFATLLFVGIIVVLVLDAGIVGVEGCSSQCKNCCTKKHRAGVCLDDLPAGTSCCNGIPYSANETSCCIPGYGPCNNCCVGEWTTCLDNLPGMTCCSGNVCGDLEPPSVLPTCGGVQW